MTKQISLPNHNKKVCIIVPVYNAEKYLGYCLNSILSQTYTNWNAILVDDGSTDGSLEICRSYEAIDSRFHVLTKINGGVSSARNFGLRYAQGDYLEFIDSDDCLEQSALEKQVSLAVENDSQLVIMNMKILSFQNPKDGQILCSSSWLGQSPCVLSAEEFRQKRMRLIWFTVLLEGPCAKLYDLAVWKQHGIRFPEDVSLGEDFLANMEYYSICNKVVFLNECGYYYNKNTESGSLSEKYRSDLFEVKMFLMEKLEEHLGGRNNLSEPERDAFYCYAACSGFFCVERAVLFSGMDEEQMTSRLQEMFSHPLFAESVQKAGYIPERFVACVDFIKEGQMRRIIRYIADQEYQKAQEEAAVQVESEGEDFNPGLLNRLIRKSMRLSVRLLGTRSIAARLTLLERNIEQYGLKVTWQIYSHAYRKVTRGYLEEELQTQTAHVGEELQTQTARVREELQIQTARVREQLQTQTAHVGEQLQALKQQVNEQAARINDYTWLSEQRITRYEYLRDINELRQRKKAIMLATAEHANIGDSAITLAEQQLLSRQFPEYFQVEISTYEFNQKEGYLHAILNTEDILFIHGGGNIGDQYFEEENLHRKIIAEFPNNKIVIFPQTIHFSSTAYGQSELQKSARIYNGHKDITLFVRGKTSLVFAKEHFNHVKTFLMPDIVSLLRSDYFFDRRGALICMREDAERKLSNAQRREISNLAMKMFGGVEFCTNIHTEDITRDIRGLVVRKELMRFASHQVVITDRLHGMIFSAVTGTPCVVFSSSNHKIQEYYEAFFQDSNAVFFIGEDMGKLENAIKGALQATDASYPVLEKNSLSGIREIVEG